MDSIGINALRLSARSGDESPLDRTTEFLADVNKVQWFKEGRYASVNDNDDPFTIDPAGFQFGWVDHLVRTVVLPVKERLEARGETLYLTLTFVDFDLAQYEQLANPEEYAEYALAMFQHLRDAFGLVPDALEIKLEPDVGQIWDADRLASAIVAAGDRLKAHGFEPDIVAPSTTSTWQASQYFDRMAMHPRVMEYLTDLAYHRYRDDASRNVAAIGERAERFGIRSGMLEHLTGDYHELHEDLALGRVSRWQQFAIGWPRAEDDGTVYALVLQATKRAVRVVATDDAALLSQYFRIIRRGAVRIGTTSDNPEVDPLAFENTDGSIALVVKTNGESSVTVLGLPAGPVDAEYMTEAAVERRPIGPLHADARGSVTATIPGRGVLTFRSAPR